MTLDWPHAVVVLGGLAAFVVGLRTVLPYVVGTSSEKARAAALRDVTERLNKVEAHLASGGRRMPGRL